MKLKHLLDDLLQPPGVLVDWQIERAIERHGIIEGADKSQIKAASCDVRYGGFIKVPILPTRPGDSIKWELHEREVLRLHPRQFVLASTIEVFRLPRQYAIDVKLRSTWARMGLYHALAGWGEPGFDRINGATLTLELSSWFQTLHIEKGQRIAQVVIVRCAGRAERDYSERASHYLGQRLPQEARY